jgi:hypothetical protein
VIYLLHIHCILSKRQGIFCKKKGKVSHPFLRTKIGCIKYSCAPQDMIAHISRQIT